MWVLMVRRRSRLAVSSGWVWTSSSSCLVMVAIRMTLSCGGIGVGAVCVGWSSALLVVVLMGSSVGWNGDPGCAPRLFTNRAAIGAGAPVRPAMVALRHRLQRGWWFGR